MILLLLVVFLVLIILGSQVKNANVFSPWLITSLVWFSILVLYYFNGSLLRPLSDKFFISLFLWVTSLSLTSIITFTLTKSSLNINNDRQFYNRKILKCFILLSLVFTPIYFYVIIQSLAGDYSNIFLRLRDKAVTGGYSLGLLGYIETLNFVMLVVTTYLYPRISKKAVLYFLLVNILTGFAIMEKGTFFEIFVTIIFILYLKKKIKVSTIVYVAIIFLIAMIGFQLIRSDSDSIDVGGFLTLYILSPSAAFDTLSPSSTLDFGANTFSFYYKLSNALFDTNFTEIPMLKDFVYVPMGVNVYTVMQPYYEDFGYYGVFLFGIINGIISGFLYKKSLSGQLRWVCLYTFVCEYYILQFFQERLFISHSDFLQILIFSSLLTLPIIRYSGKKSTLF